MILYVFNTSLEVVDIIDTYSSIIWVNRFFSAGDFELYVPATDKMIQTLQPDYLLVREGKETNAMIIEKIVISTDVENGNYLTVTGKSLKSILSRRIIWNQTNLVGQVEACIRRLLSENAINPAIAARKITRLQLGAAQGLTYTMSAQFTGNNLEETIASLCEANGIGYDVLLDLQYKKFTFVFLLGEDRSYNQDVNPYVVFSNEFENLLTSTYSFDKSEYKNTAKVAGEGEGLDRKYVSVGTATELDRYEMYVDSRDSSSNNSELTTDQYNAILTEKGNAALIETKEKETYEGEVESNYTYTYGEDYFLGDIVEVINEYGIAGTPRIIEVIESEDENGIYTIPTFSTF